ncbi:DUF7662 domain-containing protein [Bradyrhizobium sp. ISRA442]|uniref:DUF7662 domain-containing protein n=1 Tax=Bradyrhizobium sp. ISRA442 TaxID=2866197 RepID=UPI00404A7677
MSIYDPLQQRLARVQDRTVRLTFAEIEALLGRSLPASAYRFSAWWGNETSRTAGHTQSRAWLLAGFRARVSLKLRTVEFERRYVSDHSPKHPLARAPNEQSGG